MIVVYGISGARRSSIVKQQHIEHEPINESIFEYAAHIDVGGAGLHRRGLNVQVHESPQLFAHLDLGWHDLIAENLDPCVPGNTHSTRTWSEEGNE